MNCKAVIVFVVLCACLTGCATNEECFGKRYPSGDGVATITDSDGQEIPIVRPSE